MSDGYEYKSYAEAAADVTNAYVLADADEIADNLSDDYWLQQRHDAMKFALTADETEEKEVGKDYPFDNDNPDYY